MNKLTQELSSLFKPNEGPTINSIEGTIKNTGAAATKNARPTNQQIEIDLTVPAKLLVFDGHFPNHAVFPGVVQIDWAGKFSRQLFLQLGQFKKLANIKFTSVIFPNTRLTMKLIFETEKLQVKFQYYNQTTQYSSGILAYSAP